jgi:NRAMP (natural resistance-associated macrophage protein)-like metal ion transporter
MACAEEVEALTPAASLKPESRLRRLLRVVGPGVVTGASDDDPSGIGTYAVAGARLGFAMLWMALLTFPLMVAVQFMCAKISMVTGKGLAGVLRDHYPRGVLIPAVLILLITNTLNVGANLLAMAEVLGMFVPLPLTLLILPIAGMILAIQVFGAYGVVAGIFKWLSLSLLGYLGAAILAKPHWLEVLKGTFLPTLRFEHDFMLIAVGILGTTISPYLFFWQGDMEVEEEIRRGRMTLKDRGGVTDSELRDARMDVTLGMFFSNVGMYVIILATGATLYQSGMTTITSASDAATALRPVAGEAAGTLFALGILGTGFLSVPILTCSASYAISEALGWRYGLNERPSTAKRFYGIIIASTVTGALLGFLGINPIDALVWTAILNGLIAPPLLLVILHIANDRTLMGDRVNGWVLNLLGWGTTLVMGGAALGLMLTWLRG